MLLKALARANRISIPVRQLSRNTMLFLRFSRGIHIIMLDRLENDGK